ncbi:hypothetical protein RMQ97_13430 [Maricaulis sp. D1M11]|uniref:hypothetical protein n=1 Tax=Maricaulis sp. D1M11 TaxID=3076117 RepID=UPI0039B4D62D
MMWMIWQMAPYLLVAFGIGVLVGWLIWSGDARAREADKLERDNDRLRRENDALARRVGEAENRANEAEAVATEPAAPPVIATQDHEPAHRAEEVKSGATGLPDASETPTVEAPAAEVLPVDTPATSDIAPEPVNTSTPEALETSETTPVKSGADGLPEAAKSVVIGMPEPAEADDLTVIRGLGPKAAASLLEGGVTRIAQIAEWGEADVTHWDEQINGRGRIARDDWVGQARSLTGNA